MYMCYNKFIDKEEVIRRVAFTLARCIYHSDDMWFAGKYHGIHYTLDIMGISAFVNIDNDSNLATVTMESDGFVHILVFDCKEF